MKTYKITIRPLMQKKVYWYFHQCTDALTVSDLTEKVADYRNCQAKDFKVLEIREV